MKTVRLAVCFALEHYLVINRSRKIVLRCKYGLYCKFVELLSKAVNREFHFVPPEVLSTPSHPVKNTDCRIEDMLRYNKSDISPEMGFSYEAFQKVDFSSPAYIKGIKFAIKQGEEISKDLVIFYPFQFSVWLCTLISLLLCSFVLSAMMHRNSTTKRNIKSVCLSTLCCLEIFSGVRDFRLIRGKVKREIFCAIGLLFMRILVYCFLAVFLSFLLAPIKAPPIKTFAELGRAAKLDKIKIALPGNQSYVTGQMQRASETNEATKSIFDNNYRHIHGRRQDVRMDKYLLSGYILIGDQSSMDVLDAIHEDIDISDDSLSTQIRGLFYRKGFEDIEAFNKAVLRISESGAFTYHFNMDIFKVRYGLAREAIQFTQEKSLKPISWLDLKGAFILFAIGNSLALIVFICEKFSYKGHRNKRGTVKKRLCSA